MYNDLSALSAAYQIWSFITLGGVMAMKRNSVSYLLMSSAIKHVRLTQGDGEKQGQEELR